MLFVQLPPCFLCHLGVYDSRHGHLWNSTVFRLRVVLLPYASVPGGQMYCSDFWVVLEPIFFHYILFSSARALIIEFECSFDLSSTKDIVQLLLFCLLHFRTCLCACPPCFLCHLGVYDSRHGHLWNSTVFRLRVVLLPYASVPGGQMYCSDFWVVLEPIFFHYILFSSARALIIEFECSFDLSNTKDIMQLLLFRLLHFRTCFCACPCNYANSKVICDCYSYILCCWHHRRLHFTSQGRKYYLQ